MAGSCNCKKKTHPPKLIVITGGPGAGKTAVLETARNLFCSHISILSESASIIFSGGFPRKPTRLGCEAVQKAIFHVQREQEWLGAQESESAIILCDRGTIDGAAYWPEGGGKGFAKSLGIRFQDELKRYAAVIHLRTPNLKRGYNHQNPVRIESAEEATRIDRRILSAWESHPRRYIIESTDDFIEKTSKAMRVLLAEIPSCCRTEFPSELFGFGSSD